MSLMSFFKRTSDKTKVMQKLIKVLDVVAYDPVNGFNKNLPSKKEKEMAHTEFFQYISNDKILGGVLKEYNFDYDKYRYYMDYILQNGWGWENGRYLPVDVFSFEKEMRFFLESMKNNEDINLIYLDLRKKNY